jgi:hypothetical protein
MEEGKLKKANLLYRQSEYDEALLLYKQICNNSPYFKKILSLNMDLCNKYRKVSQDESSKPIFCDKFIEQNNWIVAENIKIQSDGSLNFKGKGSFQCALRENVTVRPDKFYELTFNFRTRSENLQIFWIIRDGHISGPVNYYDGNMVPIVMHKGAHGQNSSIVFRSFCRTKTVNIYLFVNNCQGGEKIYLENIALNNFEKVGFLKPVLSKNEKIIASLASIPQREDILKDVVRSLYHQVDEIRIFLNGYSATPNFLQNDIKIITERSQIWGDDGDAGKFFWASDPTPGYRLVCDDDIIYPIDYSQKLIQKIREYDNKAIIGLHGILLKQPIKNYYGKNERYVTHCRNEVNDDHTCHMLGTGAIAYHQKSINLSKYDFQFRNMADIWFGKKAQEQRVPLISMKRPHNWVMLQPQASYYSIYQHSVKNQDSNLNTADVQNSVVREIFPISIYPPKNRKKVVFSIKTYNRYDYLKDCVDSFLSTRSLDFEWVVIIADDGSTDGTIGYLDELSIPHELHIIKNERRYAVGQCNTIFQLSLHINFDFGFQVDDDVIFTKSGWDKLYFEASQASGFDHLCFLHQKHYLKLRKKENKEFKMPEPVFDHSGHCEAYTHVEQCMGALFTFTPSMINEVGGSDEENFPIRGQWHIDLSIRACRAGHNQIEYFFDAKNSNDYILLQNDKRKSEYRCSIPWSDDYKKTKKNEEIERRYNVIRDDSRIYIQPIISGNKRINQNNINSFFDKIYVLNLDRRPDRWKRIKSDAERIGLDITRFPAIDGKKSPHLEQYYEYLKEDIVQVPDEYVLNYNFDLYRNYKSDISRVAYIEKRNGRKAIGSPGAWGYLLTMINILQDALKNGYQQILVLDDDVIFHRQTKDLFIEIMKQVPEDWLILQLGALQYNWDAKWIEWYSDNLYVCNGSSLGSHAVGIKKSIIPLILNDCLRFDLPYDEGPLHKPKALYPEKCLTFYPNLMIQDVSESDISEETGQKRAMSKKDNSYRWQLENYQM